MSGRHAETEAIKASLQARAESLVRELVPDGRKSGHYWIAKNPTREDRRAGSFWIKISGGEPGCWRDEATGDKGDIFRLIQYIRGGDFKDALDFARGFLGIAEMPPEKWRERAQADQAALKKKREEEAAQLWRDRRRAKATWLNAEGLAGSLGARYLASRGIYLADLPRTPRAVRFSPSQKHMESGQHFPALVSAMTGPDGGFYAIHRTFIAPDGGGKAPVQPVRKMWPQYLGAAIHLWRGETGLPPREAAAQGLWDVLAICEGIEDGLSLALACPELRVWCAGGLSNLANIRLPECCGEVIVAADNDWGKEGAERLLQRGLRALAAQGRPVKVAHATTGKDVNDQLRGLA